MNLCAESWRSVSSVADLRVGLRLRLLLASCGGAEFSRQWNLISCRTMGVRFLMKPLPDFPPPLPARLSVQSRSGAPPIHNHLQEARDLSSPSVFRAFANELRAWSPQILARADDDDPHLNHLDDSETKPQIFCSMGLHQGPFQSF